MLLLLIEVSQNYNSVIIFFKYIYNILGTQQRTEKKLYMSLIAYMIKEIEKIVMIKTAITLRKLLQRNKTNSKLASGNEDIVSSYEKIAINSASDARKATVSNAFGGETRSAITTVILIVESMGFTMIDFGETYNNISDKEVKDFQENIINKKKL